MIRFLALMLVSSMALATPPNHSQGHGNGPSNDNQSNSTATGLGGEGGDGGSSDSDASNRNDISNDSRVSTGDISNASESYSEGSDSSSENDNRSEAVNTVNNGDETTFKQGDVVLSGSDISIIEDHEAAANTVNLNLAHCSDGAGASSKSGSISTGGVNYVCEASRAMGLILTTIPRETPEEVEKTLEKAKDIKDDVYDYMKIRKFTAAIGALFRDIWPGLGLLVLVL